MKKDTREHILQVALGLFLRKTFKEVTMNEIVKQTGMSKGAFYHYFKSKEQLFLEILDSFLEAMVLDYSKFTSESLYHFGREYIAEVEKRMQLSEKNQKFSLSDINYFFLIFDGMKHFPAFRKRMNASQKNELAAWRKIVGLARKKGEIKSGMTDEQIAKIFVFITDGVGMRLVMGNKMGDMRAEVLALWDGLYHQLKG